MLFKKEEYYLSNNDQKYNKLFNDAKENILNNNYEKTVFKKTNLLKEYQI